ncbi:hypothetical protein GN956_G16309 [Arapaima gigas]
MLTEPLLRCGAMRRVWALDWWPVGSSASVFDCKESAEFLLRGNERHKEEILLRTDWKLIEIKQPKYLVLSFM